MEPWSGKKEEYIEQTTWIENISFFFTQMFLMTNIQLKSEIEVDLWLSNHLF